MTAIAHCFSPVTLVTAMTVLANFFHPVTAVTVLLQLLVPVTVVTAMRSFLPTVTVVTDLLKILSRVTVVTVLRNYLSPVTVGTVPQNFHFRMTAVPAAPPTTPIVTSSAPHPPLAQPRCSRRPIRAKRLV
jgi:hypothetical protein